MLTKWRQWRTDTGTASLRRVQFAALTGGSIGFSNLGAFSAPSTSSSVLGMYVFGFGRHNLVLAGLVLVAHFLKSASFGVVAYSMS